MRRINGLPALMLAAGIGAAWVGTSSPAIGTQVLEALIDSLETAGSLEIEDRTIYADPVVIDLYERRGFEPLWTQASLEALVGAVRATSEDGLDPDVYHAALLAGLSRLTLGPDRSAALELLATDATVRLSRDLRFGRVVGTDPDAPSPHDGSFGTGDPAREILDAAASGLLERQLAALRPGHLEYARLVRGLARLRAVERRGGWAPIPPGPILKKNTADARVSLLRDRLLLGGDFRQESQDATAPDPTHFDDALEDAVRRFQHRHGLNEDGRVGDRTLAALNVPVEARIEQVRVNLERLRRTERNRPDDRVSVNVPGARVYVSRDGRVEFESRVVVGALETQTPSFDALMSYVEVNPTWTVPRGMVGEVLAAVLADPNYLNDRDMSVLDDAGNSVDLSTLDFSAFTPETFPYVFHQAPGPLNPLGRIKLIFPNDYAVYLHDSPARWAFAEERRLYSHGCVRVEDPVGLAAHVLNQPGTWTRETLEDAIAAGVTRAIPLTRPLRVFVEYRTVDAERAGPLHFYEDVYERDPVILAQLDARR